MVTDLKRTMVLGIVSLCGCAATPPSAPVPTGAEAASAVESVAPWPEGVLRAYVWQCEDSRMILMRNLLGERAVTIDLGAAGIHRLEQTVSASGVRYADDATVFWTKGRTARLERHGQPAVQCEERRAESLREDARERGVVYRALGNEPGWTLEIGPGRSLTWTTNFGEDRQAFAMAPEAAGEKPSRVFIGHGGAGETIRATLRQEPCIDDGEVRYDHSATVEFAGQTYRGCGTKLN